MAYPSASDFQNPAAGSAWYIDSGVASGTGGTSTRICSTTGWDALVSLQTNLSAALALISNPTSWDGSPVGPNDALVNAQGSANGWNAGVLRALYAVANHYGASSYFLSAIQSDGSSGVGPVSIPTLRVGIWIGLGSFEGVDASGNTAYGAGDPTDISIPDGAILPLMDLPPPFPSAGTETFGASCFTSPQAASLIPVSQTILPYVMNPLIAFGVIATAALAAVYLSRDVPVHTTRRNPRRRKRRFGIRQNHWGL